MIAGNETITIGALATHYAVESHRLLPSKCSLLPETAAEIGAMQVRNRGTVGGSIAHADPAADWPATMLALDAQFDIAGSNGERTVSASGFFWLISLSQICNQAKSSLSIRIATPPENSGGAYVKMRQSASGFALAGVAAHVTLDDAGNCASVAVGVTGVAPAAYRAQAVEDALVGQGIDAVADAAAHVADGVEEFQEDHHASGDYRAHLARVFTQRALSRAIERAA